MAQETNMALSNEDKKDVKGAFGKAIANKVSKVTRDRALPGSGRTQEIANRIKAKYDKSSGQTRKLPVKQTAGDLKFESYTMKNKGNPRRTIHSSGTHSDY